MQIAFYDKMGTSAEVYFSFRSILIGMERQILLICKPITLCI